ncbi:MAG: histidinol dehydrogenase [Candidatus Latescibacterota bacterium]|nr:histidinol dehydrogenase [Candidatus Latescibacterota bacterium]
MLEIVTYKAGSEPTGRLAVILARQNGAPPEVEETVSRVLAAVRERGDAAVAEFTSDFDGVDLEPGGFRVPAKALEDARAAMDADLAAAAQAAVANIRAFHERQRTDSWTMDDGDGVSLGKRVIPLHRVGICVPGGQAPLISSLLMAAVPAQVAGVDEICVVTPPQSSGLPHPDILATAQLLGLSEVHGIGGAQAVAALAYGTDSIDPVDTIVGPGSIYTVEAKRRVYGVVGIEMAPGPSEIVVLADDTADPAFVAADLLSQAEHGTGFEATVSITTSRSIAEAVQAEVERQKDALPDVETVNPALDRFGAVVLVDDLETGVELVNRMAPEHLELLVAEPRTWLEKIRNAGAVFLGEASTEPVGDYFAGTNHVLPTNGAARYASSLGLSDFVKTTSVVEYSAKRLRQTGTSITTLARAEGFEAHARAVEMRLEKYAKEDGRGTK